MFHFPGQREGEEVLMVIRKHPIVYVKAILIFTVAIVAPLAVFLWIWLSQYPQDFYYERGLVVQIFACLYALYGLLFLSINWLNDAFDVFILTNQRLIDITQVSLLRRMVTSTALRNIQDATSKVNGFLETMLNYGDVFIQTASGDATDIEIDQVPRPGNVARDIMEVAYRFRGNT